MCVRVRVCVSRTIIVTGGSVSPNVQNCLYYDDWQDADFASQTSVPIFAYVYGRLVGIQIFVSIFVIKWPHPKVNKKTHTELKLTSPLMIPPYIFTCTYLGGYRCGRCAKRREHAP